jgi:hypothetical protein
MGAGFASGATLVARDRRSETVRFRLVAAGLTTALVIATPAAAHVYMSAVGELVELTDERIEMRDERGERFAVGRSPFTMVYIDQKSGSADDLKPGLEVLVVGYADTFEELYADSISVFTTPSPAGASAPAPLGRRPPRFAEGAQAVWPTDAAAPPVD